MAKIPFISTLVGEEFTRTKGNSGLVDKVAGWGAKPSGEKAAATAARRNLTALFLEDGFLRSFGTGDCFPPLSLVVDDRGIYYDSTRPSAIEDMLNSDEDLLAGTDQDIKRARALLLQNHLSKYNNAPLLDNSALRAKNEKCVLIVDQTVGDLSIKLGGGDATTFAKMLTSARAENPDATIYIKTHPEVSSGRKRGHYANIVDDTRTVVLRDIINPLNLIKHMDCVYVVSSTMGFEALLLGKPVVCFGMPWYAGWGVTDDRLHCPRRAKARSVDELFAAGYFHYSRYLDPVTRQRGTIFDVIDWLIHQRASETKLHSSNFKGRLICIGFRRWKQFNIQPLLSLGKGGVAFVKDSEAARALSPGPNDHIVWWGTTPPHGAVELAQEKGAGVFRMEDGFVRSVGLGSDLIAPLSLVVDRRGIYFDPRQPSDLEHILSSANFADDELKRAQKIRAFMIEHGITKYNVEKSDVPNWPSHGRRVILVPGQVEDDASIRFGCSAVRTNLDLLEAARNSHPDAFIVYKPHPDVMSGNRKGKLKLAQARLLADHIETEISVTSCIEACDEIHTMTSLAGFDALLRRKKVTTYGQPFYAGWGLTEDRDHGGIAFRRRTRKLTLDELVAGALLRYPLYWDPVLKGYTDCEATMLRIVETRQKLEESGTVDRLRLGYIRRRFRKAGLLAKAWLSRWE